MFLYLKEIVKWLGVTVFEIWLNFLSILIFSVLAVLKDILVLDISWWYIFIPLFVCDGLNGYFCAIVFIRMLKDGRLRLGFPRMASSLMLLICIIAFKVLLCMKLNGDLTSNFSAVFAPVYVALQLLLVRVCRIVN